VIGCFPWGHANRQVPRQGVRKTPLAVLTRYRCGSNARGLGPERGPAREGPLLGSVADDSCLLPRGENWATVLREMEAKSSRCRVTGSGLSLEKKKPGLPPRRTRFSALVSSLTTVESETRRRPGCSPDRRPPITAPRVPGLVRTSVVAAPVPPHASARQRSTQHRRQCESRRVSARQGPPSSQQPAGKRRPRRLEGERLDRLPHTPRFYCTAQ